MPIYRVFGNSYNDHEIWVRAKDKDEALKIADDAPEEAWDFTGEGYKIHAHDVVQPTGPDEKHEEFLYKPKEVTNG